ncbi:CpsD/CapB family tyrosine-protein kinase [Defluviimonas sp. WL0002]|uniref:CpsD/CapB family tyrosine-protein kinase n=1 Tax=Albidovulum marisflavi TaxID=2984159 RepID=A0ABT2Z855_9RHOB|nr:CpsD/CapB family tyrosine-protein kinase [Defluviimonas sp. WL0002]MCV2867319.1 CpsD/CapB family tyrosine-protein kinase [Defluviimonas sp. WL0002]
MEKLEAAMAKARERRKAVLREAAAPSRKTSVAVPVRSGQPVDWSTVPVVPFVAARARRFRIGALLGGRDATPYDLLRSRALRLMKENAWTRLAITSPEAACGKSTIALNLALSLARQKDMRVMLFDFDFRRPNLHKIVAHEPAHSMHEVLKGDVPFFDVAARITDNLVVGLNAGPGSNPAELFQSERFREILEAIQRDWQPDVMIFDTPPMMAADDHVNLMGQVDCALLVVAAEMSKLSNVDFCEKELGQLTNVLGIVLNKCRYPDDAAGYGYYDYYE